MPYIITNGIDYIKKRYDGKYVRVSNETLADRWESYQKAQNILGSSIPKSLKTGAGFCVKRVNADCVPAHPTIQNAGGELQSCMESLLSDAQILAQKLTERNAELCEMQSKADREVSDILHYIEFNSLNACKGYKAYKMLRETLLRRREVKNEQQTICVFQNVKITPEDVARFAAEVSNPRKKTYTPRELPELFEEKV